MIDNSNMQKTILFLAANPRDSTQLRLDKEAREIEEALIRSQYRNNFELKQKWAVRPYDIQEAILRLSPHIVHFSGHGIGKDTSQFQDLASSSRKAIYDDSETQEGLFFEDDTGKSKLVSKEAIASMFSLFTQQVQCVLLNACYSETQALEISKYIPFVIGMNKAVGDKAAIIFAEGFYSALGEGKDIDYAYKYALVRIQMEGIPEHLTPVLIRQNNTSIDPEKKEENDLDVINFADFYINFSCEEKCYQEIEKHGSLIRIKSPSKMGKSSLMGRILAYCSEKLDYRTATLDLDQTNRKFFDDIDKFMQWFCASVGKQLNIRVKTDEYWDDIFGANDNATDYFEKYLLTPDSSSLVLAIDNFDRIFQYSDLEIDLSGLLRGWHEAAKIKPQWQKLHLIIVYSQESYAQHDINQSPFNVGFPFELKEFSFNEVQKWANLCHLNLSESQIQELMNLIGGHPYLISKAFENLRNQESSFADFLQNAPTEAGIYKDYLVKHSYTLNDNPDLREAMKAIVNSDEPIRVNSELGFKLEAMGLISRVGNNVKPRSELCRIYFKNWL